MGKYPVLCILALLAGSLLAGCDPSPTPDRDADASPVLTLADGTSLEWAALRGEWVLVNYWAEWCQPCLEEIPELNALAARDNITVLAVNYDGVAGQALKDLGASMGIEYPMLADNPAQALGWDMPQGLPATFLVAPDGTLRDTLMGAQTETELMVLMQRD